MVHPSAQDAAVVDSWKSVERKFLRSLANEGAFLSNITRDSKR